MPTSPLAVITVDSVGFPEPEVAVTNLNPPVARAANSIASAVYLAFFFYFERGVIGDLLPRLFPGAPWLWQRASEDVKGE